MNAQAPDISIIVLSWNTLDLTRACLRELYVCAEASPLSYEVVVIDNQSASQGWPGGIQERFAVEGWATRRVNGRSHDDLAEALHTDHPGRPLAVVARLERKNQR